MEISVRAVCVSMLCKLYKDGKNSETPWGLQKEKKECCLYVYCKCKGGTSSAVICKIPICLSCPGATYEIHYIRLGSLANSAV